MAVEGFGVLDQNWSIYCLAIRTLMIFLTESFCPHIERRAAPVHTPPWAPNALPSIKRTNSSLAIILRLLTSLPEVPPAEYAFPQHLTCPLLHLRQYNPARNLAEIPQIQIVNALVLHHLQSQLNLIHHPVRTCFLESRRPRIRARYH